MATRYASDSRRPSISRIAGPLWQSATRQSALGNRQSWGILTELAKLTCHIEACPHAFSKPKPVFNDKPANCWHFRRQGKVLRRGTSLEKENGAAERP